MLLWLAAAAAAGASARDSRLRFDLVGALAREVCSFHLLPAAWLAACRIRVGAAVQLAFFLLEGGEKKSRSNTATDHDWLVLRSEMSRLPSEEALLGVPRLAAAARSCVLVGKYRPRRRSASSARCLVFDERSTSSCARHGRKRQHSSINDSRGAART